MKVSRTEEPASNPGAEQNGGLGFFRHNDPEDQVDDGARKGGEDSDQGVENPHERGVPAEPFGQAATDPPDHAVGG